jgi:hypothetical protein
MIDIEKHKIYIPDLQMDVIPYKVVVQALQEVNLKAVKQIDEALENLQRAINQLNENAD